MDILLLAGGKTCLAGRHTTGMSFLGPEGQAGAVWGKPRLLLISEVAKTTPYVKMMLHLRGWHMRRDGRAADKGSAVVEYLASSPFAVIRFPFRPILG